MSGCSEGQWFAVDQGPWGLSGVAGQGLSARVHATSWLGAARSSPSPGHLASPWGQERAKAGQGHRPTGLVRGTGVRHRLRVGGQGPRTRLRWGQAGLPACKLGLGLGSAELTAGPGLAATWCLSQGPGGTSVPMGQEVPIKAHEAKVCTLLVKFVLLRMQNVLYNFQSNWVRLYHSWFYLLRRENMVSQRPGSGGSKSTNWHLIRSYQI